MMIKYFKPFRKTAMALQGGLVLVLPFIIIDGKSLLRFDIPELKLYFLGASIWMDDFFIVLIFTLFLFFVFLWITHVFGRIWCGWSCPQTILTDLSDYLTGGKKASILRKVFGKVLIILLSLIVSANLIWYFITPYGFVERLVQGNMSLWIYQIWSIMAVVIWANLEFLGKRFCATTCPYARFQSVLFDKNTLVVAYDEKLDDECIKCKACVRVCPVDIDIRNGLQFECIHCTKCIDACTKIFDKKDNDIKTLIKYTYGTENKREIFSGMSRNITGGIALIFLVAFLYLGGTRNSVELSLITYEKFKPRLTSSNEHVNAYLLSVSNKAKKTLVLSFSASIDGYPVSIRPDQLEVPPLTHLQKRLMVKVKEAVGLKKTGVFTLSISSPELKEEKIEKTTQFFFKDQ